MIMVWYQLVLQLQQLQADTLDVVTHTGIGTCQQTYALHAMHV